MLHCRTTGDADVTKERTLVERLHAEADLCRNETADDIAGLLDEAARAVERSSKQLMMADGGSFYDYLKNGTYIHDYLK